MRPPLPIVPHLPDPKYFTSLSIADVTATATDNDTAGVIIMPTAVNVTEAAGAGRTAEYTVRLTSQPRAVVTVAIGGLAQFDFVVNPSTLFFGARNWNTVKIVTVTANDDDIDEGDETLAHRKRRDYVTGR